MDNIQPMLDYFGMLDRYRQGGFLEISTKALEAYVTQAAIQVLNRSDARAVEHIKSYTMYIKSIGNPDGAPSGKNFALHVVADEPPHELLYTIFVEERRLFGNRCKIYNYGKSKQD